MPFPGPRQLSRLCLSMDTGQSLRRTPSLGTSFPFGKLSGHIAVPGAGTGFSWKQDLRNQWVAGDSEGREGEAKAREGQPQTVLPVLHVQELLADAFLSL